MELKKKKLLVIRGIRPAEAVFYNAFENLNVDFVYFSKEHKKYPINVQNIHVKNLIASPKYLIDPILIFNKGNFSNRSLIKINNLEKYIKSVDAICISDTFYSWCSQAVDLAKKYNKKIIAIVWETIPNHPARYLPPYSFYIKNVIEKTDLFILRSNTVLKFTDSIHIPRSKIKVIYKGVDTNKFKPKNKPKTNKVKILYVGQLTKEKGTEDLLNTFIELCKELKNIELLIAGEGLMEEKVKRLSENYPIKYYKSVNYNEISKVYQKADVFCSPSKDLNFFGIKIWEELFSYTLMEAQASGLPIVATRCGGIPEEIGENNYLVQQGNCKELFTALKKLITDEKKRFTTGRLNRIRAEKYFDLKKQAAKTEQAILSLL